MKIVACLKQVPETTEVRIDPERGTLIRDGVTSIMNPFDRYALEEAVRTKEAMGEGTVVALCMGPPQAEEMLREAIAVGADEAILVCDRAVAGSDTLCTSRTLAAAITSIGDVALVLCGKQASDGDTAQVGPGIAAQLDLPQVTYVRRIDAITAEAATVERLVEEGYEVVETQLPTVLTVVKEINEPRMPSLRGKMAAKKATITTWTAAEIKLETARVGLEASPTRVVKTFSPPPVEGGETFEGEPTELADRFVTIVKEMEIA